MTSHTERMRPEAVDGHRAALPFSLPAEIAGWYGSAAILGAYALNSFGVLGIGDRLYQLLNLTGAAGVAWVCFRKRTWQAFWLEAIWAAIATVALLRSMSSS